MNRDPGGALSRLVRPLFVVGALLVLLLLVLPRLAGVGGGGEAAAPKVRGESDDARAQATLVAVGGPSPATSAELGGAPATAREPVSVSPGAERDTDARARLRLFAFDRASGRAASTEVELWQLDVPEDDRFTAGDVRRAVVRIPRDGLVVEDLPEGRYRAFALGRRAAGEDPPEFDVRAPETATTLAIDVPRLVHFTLDLRDVEGHPVERSKIHSGRHDLPRAAAPFASPRRPKDGPNELVLMGGGGAGGGYRSGLHTRGEGGFDAGVFRERGLDASAVRYKRFAPPGMTTVEGVIDGYEGGELVPGEGEVVEERTLVGVALPDDWFDRAILLEDGAFAKERGARIYVFSRPVLVEPGSPPDLWRTCRVEVWCDLDGYEELRFERRVGDGPPLTRVMVPADSDDR